MVRRKRKKAQKRGSGDLGAQLEEAQRRRAQRILGDKPGKEKLDDDQKPTQEFERQRPPATQEPDEAEPPSESEIPTAPTQQAQVPQPTAVDDDRPWERAPEPQPQPTAVDDDRPWERAAEPRPAGTPTIPDTDASAGEGAFPPPLPGPARRAPPELIQMSDGQSPAQAEPAPEAAPELPTVPQMRTAPEPPTLPRMRPTPTPEPPTLPRMRPTPAPDPPTRSDTPAARPSQEAADAQSAPETDERPEEAPQPAPSQDDARTIVDSPAARGDAQPAAAEAHPVPDTDEASGEHAASEPEEEPQAAGGTITVECANVGDMTKLPADCHIRFKDASMSGKREFVLIMSDGAEHEVQLAPGESTELYTYPDAHGVNGVYLENAETGAVCSVQQLQTQAKPDKPGALGKLLMRLGGYEVEAVLGAMVVTATAILGANKGLNTVLGSTVHYGSLALFAVVSLVVLRVICSRKERLIGELEAQQPKRGK